MTVGLLKQIIEENHIPEDVILMSDSGWECCATDMDGVFYNEKEKTIVFTQTGGLYDSYRKLENEGWKCLYCHLDKFDIEAELDERRSQ